MHTTAELTSLIGRTGSYRVPAGFRVEVTVKDTRLRWGRLDVLIAPALGAGSAWVELDAGALHLDPAR